MLLCSTLRDTSWSTANRSQFVSPKIIISLFSLSKNWRTCFNFSNVATGSHVLSTNSLMRNVIPYTLARHAFVSLRVLVKDIARLSLNRHYMPKHRKGPRCVEGLITDACPHRGQGARFLLRAHHKYFCTEIRLVLGKGQEGQLPPCPPV